MKATISKDFEFSASHQLTHLPSDHPCSRVHGHNYTVRVELSGVVSRDTGFVLDYRLLNPIKQWLDDTFDHRHLNDVIPGWPTAEHIAAFISAHIDGAWGFTLPARPNGVSLSGVGVSETPKTWAWWRP